MRCSRFRDGVAGRSFTRSSDIVERVAISLRRNCHGSGAYVAMHAIPVASVVACVNKNENNDGKTAASWWRRHIRVGSQLLINHEDVRTRVTFRISFKKSDNKQAVESRYLQAKYFVNFEFFRFEFWWFHEWEYTFWKKKLWEKERKKLLLKMKIVYAV